MNRRRLRAYRRLLPLLLLLVAACQDPPPAGADGAAAPAALVAVFSELDSLRARDGGAFWGRPLDAPLLIVDPATRSAVTDRAPADSLFTPRGSLYRSVLPDSVGLANTALDWNGRRWTMVLQPLPADGQERHVLLLHELFHAAQPSLGFGNLRESDNGHLATHESRVLLRLELAALRAALLADRERGRDDHLTAALAFRAARHEEPGRAAAENALELNEGLAEYTGLALGGGSPTRQREYLLRKLDDFSATPSFVRAFAYRTLPTYGYLLARREPDWQRAVSDTTDLTALLHRALGLSPPEADWETVARRGPYGYATIVAEEDHRRAEREALIRAYRATFTADSALRLDFRRMNISFDPRELVPVEGLGTVYPTLRLTDVWGVLTAERGALVADDWSHALVGRPVVIGRDSVRGDGWQLTLRPGWRVAADETERGLRLVKD